MKTGIHIQGGKVDAESVEALAEGIGSIFVAGFENHMSQETIQHAVEQLAKLGGVNGTVVSGANIHG